VFHVVLCCVRDGVCRVRA